MRAAILNPIKFYTPSTMPDYLTYFPNIDNITHGANYVYGLQSSELFTRFHVGIMYLQFEMEVADSKNLTIYKLNDDGDWEVAYTIVPTDISPVGWTGKPIYKHELDLAAGIYYGVFTNGYKSDVFTVVTDTNITQDLVKIAYLNSENDFGCIFGANTFTAYFIGQLLAGDPKTEYSSFEGDRGIMVKLRSTPQRTATLNIKGIHYIYLDMINLIFSLDTITINGVAYTNTDAPSWSPVDGGDLGDVTIKLVQNTNDYYYG